MFSSCAEVSCVKGVGFQVEVTLGAGSPSEGEQESALILSTLSTSSLKQLKLWPSPACRAVWWSFCFNTSWVLGPELRQSQELGGPRFPTLPPLQKVVGIFS